MRIVTITIIFLIGLFSCKSNSENKDAAYVSQEEVNLQQDQSSESYKRGKEIYEDFCVTCHLPNGKGIAGNFPPLDGSDWLTKKRTESIHAIKYGLQGPITVNGQPYNNVMVAMGLSDQEVADVMNYINNSWSNAIKKPVTIEEVKAVVK